MLPEKGDPSAVVEIKHVVPEIFWRRDRQRDRHTNHNTCAPLTGVYKAMNAFFVIPCFR